MPFVDLQSRLGIDLDRWLLLQSGEQPNKQVARCQVFEKEFVKCAHGIGLTRAMKECRLEYDDFFECLNRRKLHERLYQIRQQRDKLIKEGKYTPPPCHTDKHEDSP
ncbi:NADH dehydrogenase [ubiquinone] iron-sulfur protein 5 [Stegastes partitus]|uniref:NADH dehydrogenase [ubiquinone] iron-sulfur protein 5 n=1 Tax=Stegastes partitus TaxID=144197 RepID=A0A3B5BCB7_9TELE|nr:PREDICTED: NADH dehydrogenase [ubiquinone] iron-sulfur protein 5 [Stegastes partitus]